MQSGKLVVVSEVEIPDEEASPAQPQVQTVEKSPPLSKTSPSPDRIEILAVLTEIRKILSAKAGAMLAMAGSFALTAAAMVQGTPMALSIAISYDVLVFLPIAIIAYRTPRS